MWQFFTVHFSHETRQLQVPLFLTFFFLPSISVSCTSDSPLLFISTHEPIPVCLILSVTLTMLPPITLWFLLPPRNPHSFLPFPRFPPSPLPSHSIFPSPNYIYSPLLSFALSRFLISFLYLVFTLAFMPTYSLHSSYIKPSTGIDFPEAGS